MKFDFKSFIPNDDLYKNIKPIAFEIEPIKYEDTHLKNLADDLAKSQENTNQIINSLITAQEQQSQAQAKSSSEQFKWTMIIAILTLIVSFVSAVFAALTFFWTIG